MKLAQIIENYYNTFEHSQGFKPKALENARIIFEHNSPELIIDILRGLKEKRITDEMGICFNLDKKMMPDCGVYGPGYSIVEWFSVGWEFHTGDECYPVPKAFVLWKGVGYSHRVSLINYMINQLQELEL